MYKVRKHRLIWHVDGRIRNLVGFAMLRPNLETYQNKNLPGLSVNFKSLSGNSDIQLLHKLALK